MRATGSSSGWRYAAGSWLGDDQSLQGLPRGAPSVTTRSSQPMRIGVPTEIKTDEYRVAITPAGVRELSSRGHEVLVQSGAGEGSAMSDQQFRAQGAEIVEGAEAVFAEAELILKVKEPQASE